MPRCSAFVYTKRSEKNFSFHLVPSEKRNKALCMKWIQSIKQTGNLLLDGGLFICDSHFDENCFEKDLREKLHFLKNIPKILNTGQK